MTTQTQAKPLFAARLTPHRSLSPRGIKTVVGILAALALLPGLIFYTLGAWPVVGFMGLDVVALYWALSHSFRDGRRYEQVTLWSDSLQILQVTPRGQETLQTFNPLLVKLIVERDFEERTTGVKLRTKERDLVIGAFLNPDDKASFAKVFGTALKKSRV